MSSSGTNGAGGPGWTARERRALEDRWEAIAGNAAGGWSFAAAERGPLGGTASDVVRPAASTIKVPLLLAVLAEIADGCRRLDDAVAVPSERTAGSGVLRMLGSVPTLRLDELLELMVTLSDNTATNVLIDLLGVPTIEQYLARMGLADTRLRRRMLDQRASAEGRENVATAAELARLLDGLCGSELLPGELSETALAVLGRQQFNDRIPARLPADVECLHKTGELAGICHDVGVLRFDGRSVAFAALGSELPDVADNGNGTGAAAAVIAAAARAVVDVARGD